MLCRLFCTTSTTIWDLVFAISLQLYHLWTSNHLHSLPFVQMHPIHPMKYRLWPVSSTWTTPSKLKSSIYVGCFVPLVQPCGILCLPYLYNYTTYGPQTTCIRSLWSRCTQCTQCTRCSTDCG